MNSDDHTQVLPLKQEVLFLSAISSLLTRKYFCVKKNLSILTAFTKKMLIVPKFLIVIGEKLQLDSVIKAIFFLPVFK